jgi:hypothetical protein
LRKIKCQTQKTYLKREKNYKKKRLGKMVEMYELLDEIEKNDIKSSLKGIGGYIYKHNAQIKILKAQIEELKEQRMRDESTFWQALSDIMSDNGKAEENLVNVIKEAIRCKWGKRSYVDHEAKKKMHNDYMKRIEQENKSHPSIADGTLKEKEQ